LCLPLRCFAIAAVACLLVAACSPGAEYPSIFPAVHDMPPPRAEVPMDQLQVQKATEDLITQRDHLNAGAQPGASQAKAAAVTATGPATTGSTGTPAGKNKAAAPKATASQAAAAPPATTASAQSAGADPKP
jgi:hypothetical protein